MFQSNLMVSLLCCMGLALAAAAPATSWAGDGEVYAAAKSAQQAALLAVLRAPHPAADAKSLRRIGPDVGSLLVSYATDAKLESPLRLRALGWLQFFPTTSARAVLDETIRARAVPLATLRVALGALAGGFGVAALPILREHLLHNDPTIREAAAYAMGDIRDDRIPALLEDRLGREQSLAVRDALVASLQTIARRNQAK